MINAKSIDHVCLRVHSVSESREYYERIFGFTCTPKEGDNLTLLVESNTIHFFIRQTDNAHDFISNQHIAFEVDSLDQVVGNLETSGITDYKTGEVRFFAHKNYKWCEWKDPGGIRLECVEII